MDADRYHQLIGRDGTLLRRSAAEAGLAAAVPTCPGWTVGDLVRHTAAVYEHKLACIGLAGARPEPWPPPWPDDRDALEWFADAHTRLLATLRATDPRAPSWTWWPDDQTAGFWSRRMAHETAVHRADAQSALGVVGAVDDDLAVDGVDEVLTMMLAGDWSDDPHEGSTGTLAVTTDGRSWWVAMTPTAVVVGPGEVGGVQAVVTAAPSDLDLWLWGRADDRVVTVEGDVEVAERFRDRLVAATQ